MLTNEKILAMCINCARIVKSKRPSSRLSLDELQNIGFIHVKSDIEGKACSEAYYSMLHEASAPRFNKNAPEVQRYFIGTRRAMGRDATAYYCDLGALVDVKDAILRLPPKDIEVAILYLLEGRTQRYLCDLLQLSQPTISIKIQGIKDRLCYMLREYDR